jgi:hypothetical protein
MGKRSGTEKRRLTRHINLRIDERSYQLVSDAARTADLEVIDVLASRQHQILLTHKRVNIDFAA